MNISIEDREKVAVVVVGYNRLKPIQRLFSSLLRADYGGKEVPLIISIDCSNDEALYEYVRNIAWPYGNKYVRIQEKRLGLKEHIFQCGDLTEYFRAVILLEDDVFVSEFYYNYVVRAIAYYNDEDRIGGISLISSEMGFPSLPMLYLQDGSDTFLRQFPASWGECWTKEQWRHFKEWYKTFTEDRFDAVDVPQRIKVWKHAWSKYFVAYLIETERYFLYPYISHSTCFHDAGVHSAHISTYTQTNLLAGPKEYYFRPFDSMQKYDSFFINEAVYQWIGMPKEKLCIDWYGVHHIKKRYRYVLTTQVLPLKVIKTYGLQMRPIELNVKYEVEGNELFLYDTEFCNDVKFDKSIPVSVGYYYIRLFNFNLIVKYVLSYLKKVIYSKFSIFNRK